MIEHQPFLASAKLRAALTAPTRVSFHLRVAAGETIFSTGAPSRGVYLVCSGTVRLALPGSQQATLAGPGSALGLPAVVGHHAYILTAQAVEEVQLAFVPHKEFMEMLRQSPELCLEVAKMLGTELYYVRRAPLAHGEWSIQDLRPRVVCRKVAANRA